MPRWCAQTAVHSPPARSVRRSTCVCVCVSVCVCVICTIYEVDPYAAMRWQVYSA